ncbi:MAG: GAF domain-containing protein [Acidobacteriota bacterium]|nr:GAF domain-containing protein [Blastocatellia bacterium]MDW8411698.1 GAF domain-containing protein [Acidobacteriota bacterium]
MSDFLKRLLKEEVSEKVFDASVKFLRQQFNVSRAVVFQAHLSSLRATFEACSEGTKSILGRSFLDLESSLVRQMLHSGLPIVFSEALSELRGAERKQVEVWGVRSMLAAAVSVGESPLAVVSVQECDKLRKWSESEVSSFINFVDDISQAVDITLRFGRLRRQSSSYAVIAELTNQMLLVGDLFELFHTLIVKLRRVMHFDLASLNMIDDSTGQLNLVEQARYQAEKFDFGYYLPAGYALPGWCIANRRRLVLADLTEAGSLGVRREWINDGLRSCFAFPLLFNDEVFGAVLFFRRSKGSVEESTLDLVEQAVTAAAAGVYRLKNRVSGVLSVDNQSRRREDLILRVIKILGNDLDLEVILQQVVNELGRFLRASRCYVVSGYLHEENARRIYEYYGQGITPLGSFPLHTNPCISEAVKTGKSVVSDLQNDPNFAHLYGYFRAHNILSTICCLVNAAQDQFFLCVDQCDRVRNWSSEECDLVTTVAQLLSLAIEHSRLVSRLRAIAERERLFNQITTAVRRSLDIEEILRTTVNELGKTLKLEHCYIGLVDMATSEIVVRAEYCSRGSTSILGASLDRSLFDENASFETGKFYTLPRSLKVGSLSVPPGAIYVPLRIDRTLMGVLGIVGAETSLEAELDFVQAIVNQVAVAVSHARLLENSRKQMRREQLITNILRSLAESFESGEMLASVVKQLGIAMRASRCFVLLVDAEGNYYVAKEYMASGESWRAFDRQDVVEWINTRRAPMVHYDGVSIAEMYVPIMLSGKLLGVLALQAAASRQWESAEVETVVSIAGQLAVSLHNARLFELVKEGRAQWQHTFDSMADGVAMVSAQGQVTCINRALCKICGLVDAANLTVQELLNKLDIDRESIGFDPFEEAYKGLSVRAEARCYDGRYLILNIDPAVDATTVVTGLVVTVRDVTKERLAELETARRNRELSVLNAISQEITKSLELEQVVKGAFSKAVELMGADVGILMLLDEEQERLSSMMYAPESSDGLFSDLSFREALVGLAQEFDEVYAVEDVLEVGGKRSIFDLVKCQGLRSVLLAKAVSKDRTLGMLVLVFRERQSFRQSELQLIASIGRQIGVAIENSQLLSSIHATLRKLREANKLKDEFLAILSHELRTPLTAIRGWTELLSEQHVTDPEVAAGLEAVLKNCESLEQLINDLLDLSRIESGLLKLEFEPTSLNFVVISAIETVKQLAQERKVQLLLDLAEDLPLITADSSRLQQVVWNLLSNSIKFSRPNGYVLMKTYRDKDELVLRVEDNGIGIDPKFLPYVFEKFRQADSSSTRNYGGLGIGLSLVKSIVDFHGGSITAESEGPDRGSVFTVRLPITTVTQLSEEAGPNCVLVLGDRDESTGVIKSVLEKLNYRILFKQSVEAVLHSLESLMPVMIVVDTNKLGYRMAEIVALFRRKAAVPIVAIAEFPDAEEQQRLLKAGFSDIASKPFSRLRLLRLFRRVLNLSLE